MIKTATIRYNVISGTVPFDGLLLNEGEASFSEWHNGEGVNIEFFDENYNSINTLHLCDDEIHIIATIAQMLGRLDIEKIEKDANKHLYDANKRLESIRNFAAKYK
jgi:hypothetical protein